MDAVTIQVISTILIFSGIFVIASMSGLLTSYVGINNIAIEGVMVVGAIPFVILMSNPSFNTIPGATIISLLISMVTGMIFILVFAIPVISFLSNNAITATAVNILAPSIAVVCLLGFTGFAVSEPVYVSSNSWAGGINTVYIYAAILSILIALVMWFIFDFLFIGKKIKSIGEDPYVAERVGFKVVKVKYIVTMISGALAGLAGGLVIIPMGSGFSGSVNGVGYIALTIIIIGRWNVLEVALWSIFWGIIYGIFTIWGTFSISQIIPQQFMEMIPFIIPLIVFIIFKDSSNQPKSSGVPYKKGIRRG